MSKSVAFSAPDTLRFLAGLDAVGANHGNVKLLKTFWARVAEKQVTWYFTDFFFRELWVVLFSLCGCCHHRFCLLCNQETRWDMTRVCFMYLHVNPHIDH